MKVNDPEKIEWQGTIVSIQPRTNVWRYRLDNRTHYHRGYNLFLDGQANGIKGRFSVAISEKQQQKIIFRIGDEAKGTAWTKIHEVSDYADCYRAGSLEVLKRAVQMENTPPPYLIDLPDMGRPRGVPYKDSGSSYDEGWLDEICTERRGWDE